MIQVMSDFEPFAAPTSRIHRILAMPRLLRYVLLRTSTGLFLLAIGRDDGGVT